VRIKFEDHCSESKLAKLEAQVFDFLDVTIVGEIVLPLYTGMILRESPEPSNQGAYEMDTTHARVIMISCFWTGHCVRVIDCEDVSIEVLKEGKIPHSSIYSTWTAFLGSFQIRTNPDLSIGGFGRLWVTSR